jgi:hypothetical protein
VDVGIVEVSRGWRKLQRNGHRNLHTSSVSIFYLDEICSLDMFPFRINSEIMSRIDSRQDSLDGGSARRKAATYTGQHKTQYKRGQTSMPRVGFEPTIPVFDRAKK